MKSFTKEVVALGRRWAGVRPALGAVMLALVATSAVWGQAQTAAPVAVPLGVASGYGLLSGGALTVTRPVMVSGRAGGAVVSAGVRAADSVVTGGPLLAQALADLQAARRYVAGLASQPTSGNLGGQTLVGGVYGTGGPAALGTGAALTLTGDSNSVFVFKIGGDLTLGQNSIVRLLNVRPANVYWVVQGNTTVRHNAALSGLVLGAGTISFSDTHQGICGLLTSGGIQLTNLDAYDGTNVFWSARAFQAWPPSSSPPPSCVPPVCSAISTPLLNGSFEIANPACVNRLASIDLTNNSQVLCWRGSGTPDWFNVCANTRGASSAFGIPNNLFTGAVNCIGGARPALPGSAAYAGIYSREVVPQGSNDLQQQREYLLQQLDSPLRTGQRYYVSFSASLAAISLHELRDVQLGFLPAMPATSTGFVIPNATVALNSGALPSGISPNWTRVSGGYTATGTERVLALGNFVNQTGELLPTGPGCPPDGTAAATAGAGPNAAQGAYYFIDDVNVAAFPQASNGLAYQIGCGATQVQLGVGCPLPTAAGATYIWSPATGLNNPNILNP